MTAERLDWQNMNELHILHVGRADCVVMLLDTPRGRKSVVMDACGCTFQGKTPLLPFLRERKVHTIVLAVLTHLHQDHFGGFFQLIGQIPVKKLLTPCGGTERLLALCEAGGSRLRCAYQGDFSYLF